MSRRTRKKNAHNLRAFLTALCALHASGGGVSIAVDVSSLFHLHRFARATMIATLDAAKKEELTAETVHKVFFGVDGCIQTWFDENCRGIEGLHVNFVCEPAANGFGLFFFVSFSLGFLCFFRGGSHYFSFGVSRRKALARLVTPGSRAFFDDEALRGAETAGNLKNAMLQRLMYVHGCWVGGGVKGL